MDSQLPGKAGAAREHPSLHATHASLLSRVRDPADAQAWRQFEMLYREFLVRFCRRRGLQVADAEDVVQTVMLNLSKSLPGFVYDPKRGRFRDYLYRCARNAISQWAERGARPSDRAGALDTHVVESVSAADASEDSAWEQEWVAHHYRLAMQTVRQTFEARSVEVFEKSVAGASVAELAAEFAMSEQAVHKVRQRIRSRMEELIAAQVREEDRVDE